MLKLHALEYSRASRVLWLLADLDQSCERVDYARTDAFRAPDALAKVHPLGKSPVLEDGNLMIAESATILRYIDDTYGGKSHQPPVGTPDFWEHEIVLDYVESSFAETVQAVVLPAFAGDDAPKNALKALDTHLAYVAQVLGAGPFLCGEKLTLADIQISYLLALLDRFGLLNDWPQIAAYWQRLQDQPGYITALDAVGPMAPPKQ